MNPGVGELVKRAIKYLVEGLMVAIVAFVVPQKALKYTTKNNSFLYVAL